MLALKTRNPISLRLSPAPSAAAPKRPASCGRGGFGRRPGGLHPVDREPSMKATSDLMTHDGVA
jgi:hypothetical protein